MKAFGVSYIFAGFLLLVLSASAQTFTTLHSFDETDGYGPYGALVQATNGSLYGTTFAGGGTNCGGVVFELTTGGKFTTLTCFNGLNGGQPNGALIEGTNGNFYGTTATGGTAGLGTVFSVTSKGTLNFLYNFCSRLNSVGGCADGGRPAAGLVRAPNGNFYGTTNGGGGTTNTGTVFEISPSGMLKTLHKFDGTDGANPIARLIQATDGDFYGTTSADGAGGYGTIFKMTPSGTLTTFYSFDGTGATYPDAGLVQATNGDFYGTTSGFGIGGYGTVFKITPSGALTILHIFDGTDGAYPYSDLVEAANGDLFGTTYTGGANNYGTIFKITPSGTLTTLYNFCAQSGCTDGGRPFSGLMQDTNGDFYGVASVGGANGWGTVFSLSAGLGPFVKTQTTSGIVGAAVNILGSNLTDATSVTFNGVAAVFKVSSSSEISTTVPSGATTGKVEVVTATRTLSSIQAFVVTP